MEKMELIKIMILYNENPLRGWPAGRGVGLKGSCRRLRGFRVLRNPDQPGNTIYKFYRKKYLVSMSLLVMFGIAVGLAMDAFAVSVASGCITCQIDVRNIFRISLSFGLFQALMPVIGWYGAIHIKDYIAAYDHWIAFVLLSLIGLKMIYESFSIKETEDSTRGEPFSFKWLILLGIATSIDALVVGVTYGLLGVSILLPAVIIGLVTLLFSTAGFILGCKLGHIFENRIEIFGGMVLIGIGTKILIEHLFF
jgi:putative Mn2+ efflux pump MntP